MIVLFGGESPGNGSQLQPHSRLLVLEWGGANPWHAETVLQDIPTPPGLSHWPASLKVGSGIVLVIF